MKIKTDLNLTKKEKELCLKQIKEKEGSLDYVDNIVITESKDNNELNIDYEVIPTQFERIRRITGYLVGTVDRFNNAKRAEEHDRVKHGLY